MLKSQKHWKQKYFHEATAERNLPAYAWGGCHPTPPKKNGEKRISPGSDPERKASDHRKVWRHILGHSLPPCPAAQGGKLAPRELAAIRS